jgi:cell division septation protein DedD
VTDRRRRTAGPGWVASLAGALALVVVGFTLGLLAGVTFEAPSLVMSHVAGGTESVELAALGDTTPPPVPPLGASRPRVAGRPQGEGPSGARPAPEARLPAVAAPAPRRGFVVQVGSFGERAAAQSLLDRLEGNGFPGYLEATPGGKSWRVRVGPWRDEGEADRVAERLERREKLDTWVLEAERP